MICPSCQKEIADMSRFCYLCGARQMEQPPRPVPGVAPPRLYRSAYDRKIGGVCGGLGEYFEVDPTIVRILFFLGCFTGIGFVAYLVAWMLIPLAPEGSAIPVQPARRLRRSMNDKKLGGVCAGVAEFLGLDPTIVRVVWLCSIFVGGFGLCAYLLLWFILPIDEVRPTGYAAV